MAVRFLLIFFSLFSITALNAQRNITGSVSDQGSGKSLRGASVQLKSLTDAVIQRTITDSSGRFDFNDLRPDSFLLSVSFVGFSPVNRKLVVDSTDLNLEIALVLPASADLETVVIRTAITPVSQKGDTLQINASQFKVNPDASGEDLIRKVPGVTIENGQVKAQGENVQKVTIDGRELFGDDATAALRNLPAEVIDKIQIFDRLSDQAQFTGFDDGNTAKSINIITKANLRNGQFGRVFAGYGTDQRYQAGGNATIFKDNRRISLVGNFNNINQQNFSQQDLLGVTSSAQRGGGGNRGGRGGQGGGGNRGNLGGGNQGRNQGNFGNSSNFLVGQQNGINRTNAFGINYSDKWGKKVTATGSYFFNNTNNTTNEIASTQYFSGNTLSSMDTTRSTSRNNNHRVNLRIEYQIDSSNLLIFTPSLSFQDNRSDRYTGREAFFAENSPYSKRINQNSSTSSRNGNNLNNTILYRHAFAKKGRTISLNLNTSFNRRTGGSYVNTLQRLYTGSVPEDSTSRVFTNQENDGRQISTNLAYTEPVGANAQLQLNYNPSFSTSHSDQKTYSYNNAQGKYSDFLDSLSNTFRNRTQSHNGGLSYRYGNRDRMLAFGVSYQHTSLSSDQTYPRQLSVNKSFDNVLPNAMIRYKVSTRSSVRLFFRTNVNTPSVTQLQNVLDPTNAPYYVLGNPDLNPQYSSVLSGQYTFTNTTKGLLFVGNVFWQTAKNYIATAVYNPTGDSLVAGRTLSLGDQLSKPINLDGYSSLRSFLTFAVPLKFIKSNFNLNGGITFSKSPGLIDNIQNETRNLTYSAGAVIASNVSEYVDFTVSYTANFNKVKNDKRPSLNTNYFQHVAGIQLNLLSKTGWFFQNDLNNQYYNGLSEGYNQNYVLWNMSAGKKILKDRKGELKVSVFDLLGQNRSISRNITDFGIEDVRNDVLQRYYMLTFTYNLRNFGTAAARAFNREGGMRGNFR